MRQTRDAGLITQPNPSWMVDQGAFQLLKRRVAVNIQDDHFDSPILDSKWLPFKGGSGDLSVLPGWIKMVNGRLMQPVPTGDWTIETELLTPPVNGTYWGACITLTNALNNTTNTYMEFQIASDNSLQLYRIGSEKFVNNTYSSQYKMTNIAVINDHVFLAITKSGTSYSLKYAFNPSGNFRTFFVITSLGFTPSHFGIGNAMGGTNSYFNYFLIY